MHFTQFPTFFTKCSSTQVAFWTKVLLINKVEKNVFLAHKNVDYKGLMKENQAKYNNRLKEVTSDKDKKGRLEKAQTVQK